MPSFPPAPWRLRGEAWLSLWRVPKRHLPAASPGIAYLGGDCAWLATILADYRPGGTLAYRELAVAAMVRGPRRLTPACTVSQIWVDDARAAEGGRALWQIPKQLARFDLDQDLGGRFSAEVYEQERPLARLRFRPGRALPLRPLLRGVVIQPAPGGAQHTPCAGRARPQFGAAEWHFARDGALGFLADHRPLLSLQLGELRVSFGE